VSNAKQARLELMIVLHFLLSETDHEHVPMQTEIIEYGEKHFKHTIQRQRLPEIFSNLMEFQQEYPTLLRFKLGEKNTGEKIKYYVSERFITDDEIVEIIRIIQRSNYGTAEAVKQLTDKLLDSIPSRYFKDDIIQYKEKFDLKVKRHSKETIQKIEQLEYAIKHRSQVVFKYFKEDKMLYRAAFNVDTGPKFIEADFRGYVAEVHDFINKPIVFIIVLPNKELQRFDIKRMKEIREDSDYEDIRRNPTADQVYREAKNISIREFIEKSGIPVGPLGEYEEVTFQFDNDKKILSFIQESFQNHFKFDFEYKPKPNTSVVEVKRKLDLFLFIRWVLQYEISNLVIVKGSPRLLSMLKTHYENITKRLKSADSEE
jgi:hypothetical protein